jgi:hypothetical protein
LLEIRNHKSNEIFKQTKLTNYPIPEKLKKAIYRQKSLDNPQNIDNYNKNSLINITSQEFKNEESINSDQVQTLKVETGNYSDFSKCENINSKTSSNKPNLIIFIFSVLRSTENVKELIYLIKPLIYLLNISKFGRNSSLPFICNLIFDLIINKGKNSNQIEGSFSQKYLYNLELTLRKSKYLIYLARNPILSKITIPIIKRILGFFRLSDSFIESVVKILENLYLHYLIN